MGADLEIGRELQREQKYEPGVVCSRDFSVAPARPVTSRFARDQTQPAYSAKGWETPW